MTEQIIGTKEFLDKIDITDPCYNKDVWCRINNFPISAGTYECYVHIADNEETGGWGERIARIGIRRSKADHYKRIGSIGVDAGLAGFFINKPDYSDDEWYEFCETIKEGKVYLSENSFFSNSGYGDGGYDVYAGYKNKQIVEVFIEFIEEDENEDEEEC